MKRSRSFKLSFLLSLLLYFFCGPAVPPLCPSEGRPSEGRPTEGSRVLLGEAGGIQAWTALPSEIRLARRLFGTVPVGGAASAASAPVVPGGGGPGGGQSAGLCSETPCTIQVTYVGNNQFSGNEVLVAWEETGAITDPVAVLLDGVEICPVLPLPAEELPGLNSCVIGRIPLNCAPEFPGDPDCPADPPCALEQRAVDAHIFSLRDGTDTVRSICQEVIGGRPMASESAFCVQAVADPDACLAVIDEFGPCDVEVDEEGCDIVVTGGNRGPPSSWIDMEVDDDGTPVMERVEKDSDNIFCFRRSLPVATKGSHLVTITLAVTREQARTASWFNPGTGETFDGLSGAYADTVYRTAATTCGKPKAPRNLVVRQVSYGAGLGNAVLATWDPGESPYEQVHVYVDDLGGAPRRTLPGTEKSVLLGSLAPGLRTISVEGDDGVAGGGRSRPTQLTIELLTESPHPTPITGTVSCAFDPAGGGTLTASWTRDRPSTFIEVYLVAGTTRTFQRTIAGDSRSVTIPAAAGQSLALQFFITLARGHYGSPLITCEGSSPRFIPGLCSGAGLVPDISSPIFSLNSLFAGGPAPPCRAACDSNGDGAFDISDAVWVLNYLFSGGPVPEGWLDLNQDGLPDCVGSEGGADCGSPHDACR